MHASGRGVLFVALLTGCPGGGENENPTTTFATTTGMQTDTGSTGGATTVNPTTSISASATAGNDAGSTSDATASGSTSSAGTTSGSSSEGGFDCPNPMPDGEYTDCDMGCPGGNCLNIDGGMSNDYRICNRGCLSVCNCWPPPEMTSDGSSGSGSGSGSGSSSGGGGAGEYTAELICVDLETASMDGCDVPGVCSCVLECADKTCPAGMTCVDLTGGVSVCAFEVP